jgi:hypothetical protein
VSAAPAAVAPAFRVPQESVTRVVLAAAKAPSAENNQPFTFSWDGAALAVHHDAARARHSHDPRGHASCIALGCVLESIEIAAAAEDLRAEAQVSPDPGNGGPWATVRLLDGGARHGVDGRARGLRDALEARCTDRRLYHGGSPSHPVFDAIQTEARSFPGVGLHVGAGLPREALDYLGRADSYVWCHEDSFRDVLRWVRLSREEVAATRDGVAWNGFGLDVPETRLLRLVRRPELRALVGPLGLGAAAKFWLERQIASSAALVLITARSPGREALVAAGRLGFRAWLQLNQVGYGVQPHASGGLLAYNVVTDSLPATARPELLDLLRRGPEILARGFGYAGGELPVWLLRTGISPPLAPHLRAPRRPLHEIFADRSGG